MKRIYDFLFVKVNRFHLIDLLPIFIIVVLYSILSFYKLGDLKGINTFYRANQNDELVFEFNDEIDVIKMKYYTGEEDSIFDLYYSLDDKEYEYYGEIEPSGVFTWNDIRIAEKAKYIKFAFKDKITLGEVAFYDNAHKLISYSSINDYLMDEEELIPKRISYMNSSYFDEVYFARTAYQYVHGMQTYEWTHPPLGKLIQAIPIFLTKEYSPFTYRLMNNISGILMLVVMYILGLLMFKKRIYAILSSLFMAFDTFHFAQTRMGTVDGHLVLFIMLSFLFMYMFFRTDKRRYLFLSGLFFGLSIMVKWTGFYAGIALALFYFGYFIKNKKDIIESIVYGSIFFVIMPISLYCGVYLLFPNNLYYTNNIEAIIDEQKSMYNYHSTLDEEHDFSSKWYTWPVSYMPVWYHQLDISNGMEETISGVGNLVIWIGGILGFIFCLLRTIIRREKKAMYLVVMILSLWLPYMFIGRVMFLYHYFPVLPFLFLSLVYLIKYLTERFRLHYLIPIYLLFVIIFFILYYPVVSGRPISYQDVDGLKIFDSWSF